MGELWAITAFFNPAHSGRRLSNYRTFRRRLGIPLAAVELSFDGVFGLEPADADILVQLRAADVMWQKERLLNIAATALPPECRKVAWLDGDVVFPDDQWVERAARKLDEKPMIQLFSRACYLPRGWAGEVLDPDRAEGCRQSVACLSASGVPAAVWSGERRDRMHPPALGLAWAARRELLDRHGLYDACIVGGGDRAILAAADGTPGALADDRFMAGAFRSHYLAWAEAFHADAGSADGFIEGDVYHLWHGSLRDRAYVDRHEGFARFAFDPATDIAPGEGGAWRWSSDKPELHAFVRDYLHSRREDG